MNGSRMDGRAMFMERTKQDQVDGLSSLDSLDPISLVIIVCVECGDTDSHVDRGHSQEVSSVVYFI